MRYSVYRFSLEPAEKIRKQLNLSPEDFSIRIQFNYASYPAALKRGWLTRRMVREISYRFKIPVKDFQVLPKNGDT